MKMAFKKNGLIFDNPHQARLWTQSQNEQKRRIAHPEHAIQCDFFQWARLRIGDPRYPAIQWCHASLNGEHLPWSPTSKRIGFNLAAKRAKDAGMTKGVLDTFYPWPRNGLGGLWIEFKAPGGRCSPEQDRFMLDLCGKYAFQVCYNWTSAAAAVDRYLGLPEGSYLR